MARPSIEDLGDRARFEPVMTLLHAELVQQLRPLIFARGLVPTLYWLANVAALALAIVCGLRSGLGPIDAVCTVALGMVSAWIVLLPIHETLHALAYRLAGAARRQVSIVYRLRTFTAYCVADRVVVAGAPFAGVCLAPSLLLNPAIGLAIALAPDGALRLALCGVLLLHLGAASGDAALVDLVWRHRDRRLWTCDDVAAGVSHVFAERAGSGSAPA